MIEATRMWHVRFYCDEIDDDYCSEFSCDDAKEAIEWLVEEYADEAERLYGYKPCEDDVTCEFVGYTVYDGDDCIDLYL